LVLHVCVEKLHRVPEECGDVPMSRIWEMLALAEEEAERMKKSNG